MPGFVTREKAGSDLRKRCLRAGSRSGVGRKDLDAVVASHQDAILGSAQMRYAYGKPDTDGKERHGEGKRCNIGQHAMPKIVWFFLLALVARQIFGDLELAHRFIGISVLARRHRRARPELEHAVLFVRRD